MEERRNFVYGDPERGIPGAIANGVEEGEARGERRGEKRGEKRGKENALIETAKNLLNLGISIEDISKGTGLSKQKIASLK